MTAGVSDFRHRLALLATIVATAALPGCNGAGASVSGSGRENSAASSGTVGRTVDAENPIKAVATIGMVGDLVRAVGGDLVAVTQICGPGVDPHLYKATRDDVATMMEAEAIFYSGLLLEGKMSDTLIRMAGRKPVTAVTAALGDDVLLEPEEFEGHYDPHVWNSVAAWSACLDVVVDTLSEFDPANAELYAANGKAYAEELGALHAYGVKSVATVPGESRVLVTSHDAFNYFGAAYDLEVVGVQGISTESEAGLQQINGLVDLLVEKGVKAVFVESSVPRKSIDALVEGAASRGHEVAVGEKPLFSDAMGPAGTYEGTYLGMLDHNITVVTRGLGGDAPAGGLHGKLAE